MVRRRCVRRRRVRSRRAGRAGQTFVGAARMTDAVGRGPLTAEGLCRFHSDLLPMDCTLVGRLFGCVGCLLSRRNLDPGPVLPDLDDLTPRATPPRPKARGALEL